MVAVWAFHLPKQGPGPQAAGPISAKIQLHIRSGLGECPGERNARTMFLIKIVFEMGFSMTRMAKQFSVIASASWFVNTVALVSSVLIGSLDGTVGRTDTRCANPTHLPKEASPIYCANNSIRKGLKIDHLRFSTFDTFQTTFLGYGSLWVNFESKHIQKELQKQGIVRA